MASGKTGKKSASSGKGRSLTAGGRKSTSSGSPKKASAGRAKVRTKVRETVKAQKEPIDYALVYEIILWMILAVSVLIFIGMIGFGGVIGRGAANICFGLFGLMAYIFPFLFFFMTAFLISNHKSRIARIKAFAAGFLYMTLCGVMQLMLVGYNSGYRLGEYYEAGALYHTGGGWLGGCLVTFFCSGIGVIGTWLIFLVMLMIGLILLTQKGILDGIRRKGRVKTDEFMADREERKRLRRERRKKRMASLFGDDEDDYDPDTLYQPGEEGKDSFAIPESQDPEDWFDPDFSIVPKETGRVKRIDKKKNGVTQDTSLTPPFAPLSTQPAGEKEDIQDIQDIQKTDKKKTDKRKAVRQTADKQAAADTVPAFLKGNDFPIFRDDADTGRNSSGAVTFTDTTAVNAGKDTIPDEEQAAVAKTRAPRKQRASAQEIEEGIEGVEKEIEKSEQQAVPEYRFPPMSLLKKPGGKSTGTSPEELRQTAQKLQQVLQTFGVNVKITNVTCGPSVTRYEMMPEMGVKVSRIVSLQDDIKLNLAVTDIRIEAPIPGKSAVGIEVPNKKSSGVLLREVLESEEFTSARSSLTYAVGKDIAGNTIVSDIAKMPHLLIAGATGSGKSVFINTLIMSIIYKAKPEDVKMIMIDPKVVELSVYNGIPHLFIPVVTDPKKAAGALNWAVAEMMQRYKIFSETGVRDVKGYNQRVMELSDLPDKPEKMPQIVVIVDELADLMMVASSEVEDAICRLAQLARAAGIHLVIATQRPSVDVITGLIKANMPSRIAFSVSSGVDSRTILDMTGAEKLLGNGDMFFAPRTYKQPLRVQGAFVSDDEVAAVVSYLKKENTSEDQNEVMADRMEKMEKAALQGGGAAGGGSDQDELFIQAGKFLIEKDKASIGMLQRWFKIGFNRAARIMDQLADAGVVGPEEGTKPRRILMTLEEFEETIEGGE